MFPFLATLAMAGITIVQGGRSDYSIALPKDAIPSEKTAAAELQHFLFEMTGATLPIVTGKTPAKAIVLGGPSASSLGEDGYMIVTNGQQIRIAGGRPRGTLYGVYGFLDSVGCRWYTKDVSVIPKRHTIEVPPTNYTSIPAFEYREPFYTEAWDKQWASRNRCNGSFMSLDESTGGKIGYYPFVHSFYEIIPPDKNFATHPEYYSEINGVRKADGGQLCMTNPDVLRITVAQVKSWIKEHPEAKIISVSQNDWYGWCTCATCRAVIEEEGAPAGATLRFVNAVAEQIAKEFPDKLIDTLAYQWTEDTPKSVRPLENVRVRMAPIGNCFGHPIDGCERNAKPLANLTNWSKVTNNLYIWHYNTNFAHYLAPFPDFDEIAGSTRAYKRLGVKGIFFEGAYGKGGGSEFGELRSWVMARLLWDPTLDVWELVNEFLPAVYGKAWVPIRKYMAILQAVVNTEKMHFSIYDDPKTLPYLRADLMDRSERLFEEAEAVVAEQPVYLDRVRKARISIDYARWRQAPDDATRTKYAKILAEKIRKYGIGEVREGGSSEEFLKSIGQ